VSKEGAWTTPVRRERPVVVVADRRARPVSEDGTKLTEEKREGLKTTAKPSFRGREEAGTKRIFLEGGTRIVDSCSIGVFVSTKTTKSFGRRTRSQSDRCKCLWSL